MATYIKVTKNDYLMHHGIKGQKWGVRNGPPYPLKDGAHSAAEKKAGGDVRVGPHITKKEVGIALAAAAIAGITAAGIYSAVKLNGSDALVRAGRAIVKNAGTIAKEMDVIKNPEIKEIASKLGLNIKPQAYSLEADASAVNPRYNALNLTRDYNYNCPSCTFAYTLRRQGLDVQAVPLKNGLTYEEINSVFKGSVENAEQFGSHFSMSGIRDADEKIISAIKKLAGDSETALGAISVDGMTAGGHIFNWEKTADGAIHLIDCQPNKTNTESLLKRYKSLCDSGIFSNMYVMRLDDKEIDLNLISKYVRNF